MTQQEIIEIFKTLPYSEYKKYGQVNFVIAAHIQEVVTSINGNVETKNTANKGDYIVEGVSGEFYVLTPAKFDKNYVVTTINPDHTGVASVLPQPRYAVKWTGDKFHFIANWGEEMICNQGDYLVAPQDLSEVYRIEKEIFEKTYQPC